MAALPQTPGVGITGVCAAEAKKRTPGVPDLVAVLGGLFTQLELWPEAKASTSTPAVLHSGQVPSVRGAD